MEFPKRAVVIAPHPDDETLGAGGTIARLVENGTDVSVLVVSGHLPPLYDEGSFDVTRKETEQAFKVLGVKHFEFLKIPATMVNQVPVSELMDASVDSFKELDRTGFFCPFLIGISITVLFLMHQWWRVGLLV